MRIIWILLAAVVGPLLGAGLGFGAALVAMSLSPPRSDGTYGMMEMIVCLPLGALLGLIIAVVLALRLTAV